MFTSGSPKAWEKWVNTISGQNPYVALTIRNALCLIPMAVTTDVRAILLAPVITVCYHLGVWTIGGRQPIAVAEAMTGLSFGVFIVFLGYVAPLPGYSFIWHQ
jgi:hypothetical protein